MERAAARAGESTTGSANPPYGASMEDHRMANVLVETYEVLDVEEQMSVPMPTRDI